MLLRYVLGGAVAAGITFAVFFVMQALISSNGGPLEDKGAGKLIDFVRLKRESEMELKKRKMPDKKPPAEAPPPPKMDFSQSARPDADVASMIPVFNPDLELGGGPYLGAAPSDTDVIPLVRVGAQYPIAARERGIEGWVTLEFSITTTGAVSNAKVIDAKPGSVFNRAALRAISRWKYKPKIVEGKAVERHGLKVRLTFKLDD